MSECQCCAVNKVRASRSPRTLNQSYITPIFPPSCIFVFENCVLRADGQFLAGIAEEIDDWVAGEEVDARIAALQHDIELLRALT